MGCSSLFHLLLWWMWWPLLPCSLLPTPKMATLSATAALIISCTLSTAPLPTIPSCHSSSRIQTSSTPISLMTGCIWWWAPKMVLCTSTPNTAYPAGQGTTQTWWLKHACYARLPCRAAHSAPAPPTACNATRIILLIQWTIGAWVVRAWWKGVGHALTRLIVGTAYPATISSPVTIHVGGARGYWRVATPATVLPTVFNASRISIWTPPTMCAWAARSE